MWASIISAALSAGALIVVAIIGKNSKRAETRAEERKEESRLSMKLMDANAELSEVICIAVTGGHTNGNVEAARTNVATARAEYREFLRKIAANQIGA